MTTDSDSANSSEQMFSSAISTGDHAHLDPGEPVASSPGPSSLFGPFNAFHPGPTVISRSSSLAHALTPIEDSGHPRTPSRHRADHGDTATNHANRRAVTTTPTTPRVITGTQPWSAPVTPAHHRPVTPLDFEQLQTQLAQAQDHDSELDEDPTSGAGEEGMGEERTSQHGLETNGHQVESTCMCSLPVTGIFITNRSTLRCQ